MRHREEALREGRITREVWNPFDIFFSCGEVVGIYSLPKLRGPNYILHSPELAVNA